MNKGDFARLTSNHSKNSSLYDKTKDMTIEV